MDLLFKCVILYFNTNLSCMTTNTSMDSYFEGDKRNIKNIYVHKINSLMKLSKDTVLKEDLQGSHNTEKQMDKQIRKKFKKTTSQIDKSTLKLQKNRQSAKKARLRKKIYIKMLESQIQCFKKLKTEGDQLNEQLQSFLTNKNSQKNDLHMNQLISHDANVDRFLSGSNLGEVLETQNKELEKKLKDRDGTVEELYQLSTSGLIKKLKGSKNIEVFQPILKKEARQNSKGFETLIKRISHNYDVVKNSFRKIHTLTEQSKSLTRSCRNHAIETYDLVQYSRDLSSVQEFMQKLDLSRQCELIQQSEKQHMIEQSHSYETQNINRKSSTQQNDFNLCSTEKLLIRSQKFFEHTYFEQEQ